MYRDQDGCELVNVSSGTGLPGSGVLGGIRGYTLYTNLRAFF